MKVNATANVLDDNPLAHGLGADSEFDGLLNDDPIEDGPDEEEFDDEEDEGEIDDGEDEEFDQLDESGTIADDGAEPDPTATGKYDIAARRVNLQKEIGNLAVYLADLQAKAKFIKKQMAAAVEELAALKFAEEKPLPLFDQPAVPTSGEMTQPPMPVDPVVEGATSATPTTLADEDESWRNTTTKDLGLPKGICKILEEEAGITTLGGIADWSSKKGLTDIPGIGQGKADKIDEATEKFWGVGVTTE